MYELLKRSAALAEVRRSGDVADAQVEELAKYTFQLMQRTAQLDVQRLLLNDYTSELGQNLMAQELIAFAMGATTIGNRLSRAGR